MNKLYQIVIAQSADRAILNVQTVESITTTTNPFLVKVVVLIHVHIFHRLKTK